MAICLIKDFVLMEINQKWLTRVKTCHLKSFEMSGLLTHFLPMACQIKALHINDFWLKKWRFIKVHSMASREINNDRVKGLYQNPICPDMSNKIRSALWVIRWEIFRLLKDLRGQSLNWEMIQIDKDPLSWSCHVHRKSLKSSPSVPQVGNGWLGFCQKGTIIVLLICICCAYNSFVLLDILIKCKIHKTLSIKRHFSSKATEHCAWERLLITTNVTLTFTSVCL